MEKTSIWLIKSMHTLSEYSTEFEQDPILIQISQ